MLANWLWYVLVVIAGFILPRFIDRHQGQELLGVWDFGWSLVIYISFLAFGVTSAVNRYVARSRALGDWDTLNAIVTSSLAVLCVSAAAGCALALALAAAVPGLLGNSSTHVVTTAQWLVLILAAKAALQLPGGVFNGVITGYERFDLLNAIRIVRDGAVLLAAVVLLAVGYGILTLAIVMLVSELLAEVAKFIVARSLCTQLHLSVNMCRWRTIKELFSFGGKTFVQSLARGGIYQGSSLLVGVFLGPAPLAVYARQRALVVHTLSFVKQYAQVFIPRSSALDAEGDTRALRHTLIQTSKYGLYVTLPIMLVLLIMGGALLTLWMGPEYRAPWVLAVMALGHLLYIPQLGVYSVLMGIGKHGMQAWFDLGAAVAGILLGLVILGPLNGGLFGAAIAMTLPVAVSGGVFMPVYACRCLHLPMRRYLVEVVPGPLLASVPLAVCLIASRILFDGQPIVALAVGVGVGGLVTLPLYVRWVLPASLKSRIIRLVSANRHTRQRAEALAEGHRPG